MNHLLFAVERTGHQLNNTVQRNGQIWSLCSSVTFVERVYDTQDSLMSDYQQLQVQQGMKIMLSFHQSNELKMYLPVHDASPSR